MRFLVFILLSSAEVRVASTFAFTGNLRVTDWFTVLNHFVDQKAAEVSAKFIFTESRDCWRRAIAYDEIAERYVNGTVAQHLMIGAITLCAEDKVSVVEAATSTLEMKFSPCCKFELHQLDSRVQIVDNFVADEELRLQCASRPCIQPYVDFLAKIEPEVGNYDLFLCSMFKRDELAVKLLRLNVVRFETRDLDKRDVEMRLLSNEYRDYSEKLLRCMLSKIRAAAAAANAAAS